MIFTYPTDQIPSVAVYITVVSETGQQFTAMRSHSGDQWFDPLSGDLVDVESVSGLAYVTNDAVDRSVTLPQH